MKLWAISDLHVGVAANAAALRALPAYPEDWLIVAGDLCEEPRLFREALGWLTGRFAKVFWVPGNHELWLVNSHGLVRGRTAGASPEKYRLLVETAQRLGVVTPEDEYLRWPPSGEVIVPVCTLYDYSFRPAEVPLCDVVRWAAELSNVAADEQLIDPAPMADMVEWCTACVAATEARLAAELPATARTVLVGHYPLREDLVRIPRIPRFTPWCGTRLTADWHTRYRASVAVSGHLHVRRTDWRDGTRFEEVSLGYPRQWNPAKGLADYLRAILVAA